MLIDFEDHPGIFVPHDLRACFDVDSRPDGIGRIGVTQIIWPDRPDARLDDICTVRVLVLPAGEGGEQILTNGNISFF